MRKSQNAAKPAQVAAAGETGHYSFKQPKDVKGFYLTGWSAGSTRKMAKMLDLLDHTEMNAVVIDVRDDGENYFPTQVPLSDKIEGKKFLSVGHPQKLLSMLDKHGVWPIARVACFKDTQLAKAMPGRAIQNPDGTPWKDGKFRWLDPYNRDNWEYIGQIVDYAVNIGFPEIQLDYVRFPSEHKGANQVFPAKAKWPQNVKPEDVISEFTQFIAKRVKSHGRVFSADIFGIISSTKGDEGIGQELEKVAAPFDVISPMVYPSHFAKREYKIPDPNKAPYDIVLKSLHDYQKRLPTKQVRPWLQAFSWAGVHYGGDQIRAQIKAAQDVGYGGFLLWNANNRYSADGLLPKKQ